MKRTKKLLSKLKGRRTYIVAGAAIAYLVICQFTGKRPDESVMGIFGALGLVTLRAGIEGR